MNQRIRELHTKVLAESMNMRWNIEDAEKFAELIIRECCGVLAENVEVALDASGSPVYPEGLIYEHFGVEE